MRITKIRDGHYAKVLSPELTGVIARLYEEIRARKREDAIQAENFQEQKTKADTVASRIASISTRYEEMDAILKRLFPVDETKAFIDRSLEVEGTVKANTFVSATEDAAPFTVASQEMVKNLNAEFINGKTVAEFETSLETKAVAINERLDVRLDEERDISENRYAPASHVNAAGPGVHPHATESTSGFMSDVDKKKMNKFSISETAPLNPTLKQVWMDIG